jgi:UDP-N-acetyl-D-glucosamine dehydrogenase
LEEEGDSWDGMPLTDDLLSSADVAVIVTDHSGVDYQRVLELAPIVVDTRNATEGLATPQGPRNQEGWIVKGPTL